MAPSKQTKILILLAIDSVFFLIELISGYAFHSLALVADSFHMLNDVISLLVGLWAVKVATQKASDKYTYGWQRAETLGALVNGVFLVALCLSIFLEAIQRFVEPQEVSRPEIVIGVGSFGLLSNIVGLFLFHDHGHSHGGHSHGPSSADAAAEEGQAEPYRDEIDDPSGRVADIMPQNAVKGLAHAPTQSSGSDEDTVIDSEASVVPRHDRAFSVAEDRSAFPAASFRQSIIRNAELADNPASDTEESDDGHAHAQYHDEDGDHTHEHSPLVKKSSDHPSHSPAKKAKHNRKSSHASHGHGKAAEGGHSHGDLNMRGVFLHVLGDALGNVGVIGAGLFIWLTPFWWRHYTDPGVSLVITCIILASAIPLCKAAARILLQAVPAGISIDAIKKDIEKLPGVKGCHHIHVWQLNDTKIVASLHVKLGLDNKGSKGSAQYMHLAKRIQEILHRRGIHEGTIQPEFCLDVEHNHSPDIDVEPRERLISFRDSDGVTTSTANRGVQCDGEDCALDCVEDCKAAKCDTPNETAVDDHNHDDHAGHSHH